MGKGIFSAELADAANTVQFSTEAGLPGQSGFWTVDTQVCVRIGQNFKV